MSACCSLVNSTFSWIQKENGQQTHHEAVTHFFVTIYMTESGNDMAEVVITFDSLVVEVTCLLSVLSAPSVSSPGECPGEALVFFRSLLDLHWISVSRPASGDEGFTMCVKYLAALYSTAFINVHFHLS